MMKHLGYSCICCNVICCVYAGPSGVSSSQQKILDNMDDGGDLKFNSPTMKQCRGEDDTSGMCQDGLCHCVTC